MSNISFSPKFIKGDKVYFPDSLNIDVYEDIITRIKLTSYSGNIERWYYLCLGRRAYWTREEFVYKTKEEALVKAKELHIKFGIKQLKMFYKNKPKNELQEAIRLLERKAECWYERKH